MTKTVFAALPETKRRYKEQNPEDGWKFDMAASHTKLTDPDNPKNLFGGTVEWPTDEDPGAACDVRINFPGERLKNGQGYVGLVFKYAMRSGEDAYFNTELLLIHGIGGIGLVGPLSASMSEHISDRFGEPVTERIWTPKSFDEASQVLEQFGLGDAS